MRLHYVQKMITDTLSRIFSSKPVKLLLGLLILLAIASQVAPMMIDPAPYVERVITHVRQTTGATMVVKGGSKLSMLPRPSLVLRNVELTQAGAARSPSVTAEVVDLGAGIFSLLGELRLGSVRIAGVSAVAEELPQGGAQWGFLGLPTLKILASINPGQDVSFELASGRASITNATTGAGQTISNLYAAGVLGENAEIMGSFTLKDKNIAFAATRKGTMGATPVTLNVRNGDHALTLDGTMDFTASSPVITGRLTFNSADISPWLKPVGKIADPNRAADAVPLTLSAGYAQREGLISLTDMQIETMGSKATGSFTWNTLPPNEYRLSLSFDTLEVEGIRRALAAYIAQVNVMPEDNSPRALADKDLTLGLDIRASRIMNGAQNWGDASFSGTVAEGVLTVNQLRIGLPGDSQLNLFGLVSISDTQGLRFEGNTEADGRSLREMLTVFDESAANLPELGFGAYKLRSNLFISSELLRLSEATAQFSELTLNGGMVAYFDARPRIESDVSLSNIDFDYFRDSWRASAKERNQDDTYIGFDQNMNYDWLRKLGASIDFRVNVKGFTFLERKGDNASMRVFAKAGEFGIYNARFDYGSDSTEGNLKLDVTKDQPNIDLVLNTASLNTSYFMLNPPAIEPPPAPVPAEAPVEKLPDMVMPDATTPEEDLRQKIDEEAAGMPAPPASNVPVIDAEKPAPVPAPAIAPVESAPLPGSAPAAPPEATPAEPVELKPLSYRWDAPLKNIFSSLFIAEAHAQETPAMDIAPPPAAQAQIQKPNSFLFSEGLIDMSMLEGFSGTFDLSIGTLTHKKLVLQNFKMNAKLERNLLSFQTLTFAYLGGSFSINGTLFGGKVPGLSLGFILANVDIRQVLETLLGIETIGGRASISGTIDTSGVNMASWVSQASAKFLIAGRGVTVQGFDMAAVVPAFYASRTAADVFNNVNLSLARGTGEYSLDGTVNLQKGVLSTPNMAMKTGRIVGGVTGDFRLMPWQLLLGGTFKFPELATDHVPEMNVRWSGALDSPAMTTDTQALEALVSKRITGN